MLHRRFMFAVAISLIFFVAVAAESRRAGAPAPPDGRANGTPAGSAKISLPSTSAPTTLPPFDHVIREVAALVPRIANDQMRWGIWRETDGLLEPLMGEPAELSGPAEQLDRLYAKYASWNEEYGISPKRLAYPLLPALDKPQQFVVAHLILAHLFKTAHTTVTQRADGKFIEDLDGLRIVLSPQGGPAIPSDDRMVYLDCTATINPSQFTPIKQQWLRRHAQQDGPSK